jgi:hypothetical protein
MVKYRYFPLWCSLCFGHININMIAPEGRSEARIKILRELPYGNLRKPGSEAPGSARCTAPNRAA